MSNFMVTLETLKSKPINEKAIEKGLSLFKKGKVEFGKFEEGYAAKVDDHGEHRRVLIKFTKDGCDLSYHFCHCNPGRNGIICKHIVASVLAAQGGISETKISIGKSATVNTVVSEHNTARFVGSGDLDVFATPMMIALMEHAACEVLSEELIAEQSSVGTHIDVAHIAASPIGAEISATATILSINGRTIEFSLSASDNSGEIGKGKHTRVIVGLDRFMKKAESRTALR